MQGCRAVCGPVWVTQPEQTKDGDLGLLGQGGIPKEETQTGFHGNWGLEGWDRSCWVGHTSVWTVGVWGTVAGSPTDP